MRFTPNPLLYAANKDFFSAFKLSITMRYDVDHAALSRAVERAMVRYPYFSVRPEKNGESLVLAFNENPVPVFADGRCAILGSEECGGHLLAFGCEDRRIFLNASHYIADGMGIVPLLYTVLYLYVCDLYGSEGLNTEKITMPDSEIKSGEYDYPFLNLPSDIEELYLPKKAPEDVYALDPDSFDGNGLYAYHLHIPQKPMMSRANPADGSPVSFLSVMLYRAICAIDGEIDKPAVAHVQHQYRAALKAFRSRHSLVSYVPAVLYPKSREWNVERQNTVIRGQIIIGSEVEADIYAINRLLSAFPDGEGVSLEEKKRAMRKYVDDSICGKTFGISYVGKMDWYGLDKYVEDLHAYIGEKQARNMLLIEVMTVGEDFTINFMQGGRTRRYLDAFIKELESFDIPVSVVGEERYTLCDTVLPE